MSFRPNIAALSLPRTLIAMVAMTVAGQSMSLQAWAQAAVADDPAPLARVDEGLLPSARAAGMSGALSTVADDMDAAMLNPAGIGGLGWERKDLPWTRKLYFPWAGLTVNQNSTTLQPNMRSEGGTRDATIVSAVNDDLEAGAKNRHYARASLATGMVFGRVAVMPYSDTQLAAAKPEDDPSLVDLRFRATSGIMGGFSAQDPEGRLSLGYSGYMASRSEVAGRFALADFTDIETRQALITDNETTSTALGHNAGLVWRFGKKAAQTFALAVAVKDIGGTTFAAQGDGEDTTVEQDLTVGLGASPRLGKYFRLNVLLEGHKLEDADLTVGEKMRFGTELLLGSPGSYALLGLRAGYDVAGPSGGLSVNLGLLAFEAAMQSVDIGTDDEKVIEPRMTGIVYVNVADF